MDKPRRSGNSWVREAVSLGSRYLCWAASASDMSPQWAGHYDASCTSCWLGFPHTTEYHTQHTKRAGESK